MNPVPIVWAMLKRNRFTALLFLAVTALAVALGIAISAQERALREGSARAADRFDLIVAAPGSHNDVLFSVVYLDPTAVGLLSPQKTAEVLAGDNADFAAPIGFGDSHDGNAVIGTTAQFVEHLSGGLAEGRAFARIDEAVVGALAAAAIGQEIEIRHGHDDDADDHAHEDDHDAAREAHEGHDHAHHDEEETDHAGGRDHAAVTVVGRMRPTGTPWDRAVVVPIEYTWRAHDLPTGHAPGDTHIGAPFDPAHLPGVPAIVVKPETVAAAYGLRSRYRTGESTTFFPAEVLVDLYAVMGDVARVMGALTLAAQVLVVAAILAGLLALLDLQRRRFAMLRAIGAPRGFVFASVWLYVAGLIAAGALAGLPLGWAAAALVSRLVAAQTGVAMQAAIGLPELSWVAALLAVALLLALLPALLVYRRPVVAALR